MKENINFKNDEVKPLFSKLIPSDLNKGETNRRFYQFENDLSKIIRIDTFNDLKDRYENMVDPMTVVELGKNLFKEVQKDYNIQVPVEIIIDKNEKGEDCVFIVTEKIKGGSLEDIEKSPEFLEKLESLYVSISKYYLDKLNTRQAHLADLNDISQYIYGKKEGDKSKEIYLVDTDLYINKGDASLLHNVKWLIRHMPYKFDEAIENIRNIIETPLREDLSNEDRARAEKEIQESLSILDGTFKRGNNTEEGFIPTPLS